VSERSARNVHSALVGSLPDTVLIEYSDHLTEDLRSQGIGRVFLMMHGSPGEDGTIQGLLELMKIPYTSSGVLTSSLCMNKSRTKEILAYYGLPVLPGILVTEQSLADAEEVIGLACRWPAFIKPNSEGSSVGARKIQDAAECRRVLPDAVKTYGQIVAEPFVAGRELTIGVIEEADGSFRSLPVMELKPKNAFYDYEAKYTEGMTEFLVPAPLPEETAAGIRETAARAAAYLGCRGAVRVDMILDAEIFSILEVNTIPGMTATSDLPKAAEADGIPFEQLVLKILATAALKGNS
jgi:D-alanine-D-alanine ligase